MLGAGHDDGHRWVLSLAKPHEKDTVQSCSTGLGLAQGCAGCVRGRGELRGLWRLSEGEGVVGAAARTAVGDSAALADVREGRAGFEVFPGRMDRTFWW